MRNFEYRSESDFDVRYDGRSFDLDRLLPGHVPFHKALLMNGLLPSIAYERGTISNEVPLEEVMRDSRINAAAEAADQSPDFSRQIRAHLPQSSTTAHGAER